MTIGASDSDALSDRDALLEGVKDEVTEGVLDKDVECVGVTVLVGDLLGVQLEVSDDVSDMVGVALVTSDVDGVTEGVTVRVTDMLGLFVPVLDKLSSGPAQTKGRKTCAARYLSIGKFKGGFIDDPSSLKFLLQWETNFAPAR